MGNRIAKIDDNSITHQLGKATIELANRINADSMVNAQKIA